MKNHDYIMQLRIKQRVKPVFTSEPTPVVLRTAQHHHDLRKSGLLDGVSSSTSLYDDTFGEVPEVFSRKFDPFDLADALIRRGHSTELSSKAVETGAPPTTE